MTSQVKALLNKQKNKAAQFVEDLIIIARAGTGKTTTLVEGLKYLQGGSTKIEPSEQQQAIWDKLILSKEASSFCFAAFNKKIVEELQDRLPSNVHCGTMHSLGFGLLKHHFPESRFKVNNYRHYNLIERVTGKDIRELRKTDNKFLHCFLSVIEGVKNSLVDYTNEEEIWKMISHFEIETDSIDRVFMMLPEVMELIKTPDKDKEICFSDMIYLPAVLDIKIKPYDVLLVDEAQDLNPCQQELALKLGKRLILCGDDKQAIYGFAGADTKSLFTMGDKIKEAGKEVCTLPLTVTRRCGQIIVQEAQKLVEDFEAHTSNPKGEIKRIDLKDFEAHVQVGDMVLARTNGLLVHECFNLIKKGIKANIQGRDIAQGLIKLVGQLSETSGKGKYIKYHSSIADFTFNLSDWYHNESQKEAAKRIPSEGKLINLKDKYDCLNTFSEGKRMVQELVDSINEIFTDNRYDDAVIFSSIHKAKGLEADRVHIIQTDKSCIPHPMAKTDWAREQEYNLLYVAQTRAIQTLYYVTGVEE